MKIRILTIFPGMLRAAMGESILGRANSAGLVDIDAVDIRPFSQNKHKNTDDYPFGGGAGMLMLAQPIVDCTEFVDERLTKNGGKKPRHIYLSPRGRTFNQKIAEELAQEESLVFLCGHYEGVDERALEICGYEEMSLGDFVLPAANTRPCAWWMLLQGFCPACLAARIRPWTKVFLRVFWNIRSIQGRGNTAGWRFRRC